MLYWTSPIRIQYKVNEVRHQAGTEIMSVHVCTYMCACMHVSVLKAHLYVDP